MKKVLTFGLFTFLFCQTSFAQVFEWAKDFIGPGYETATGIAIDDSANVFTTGSFTDTADFDPAFGVTDTFFLKNPSLNNAFVSKLNSNGEFSWAAQIEHFSGSSVGWDLVVDDSGSILITGRFNGWADFDPGLDTVYLYSAEQNVFIWKLKSNGDFAWARMIAGPWGDDWSRGITTDSSGNVYTTGSFSSTGDFDPGAGIFNMTADEQDIFISKLDNNGDFVWAKQITGDGDQEGYAIIADSAGNTYSTGTFTGTADFDPGPDTYTMTSAGWGDIYVLKLDKDGDFLWAKQFEGAYHDIGESITLDKEHNVYTGGVFDLTVDFDPGAGTYALTSAGGLDIFVSKLDSAGNFIYARGMGGSENDECRGIAVDSSGAVFYSGHFRDTADFDPGPEVFNLVATAFDDIFVARLDSAGDFVCAKRMGGTSTDWSFDITVDSANNIYSCGQYGSTVDFDPGPGVYEMTGVVTQGVWIQKMGTTECSGTVTSSIDTVVCYSFTVPSGDETYVSSGVYMDTIPSLNCCDSVITFNLTIIDTIFTLMEVETCDMYTVPSGDETYLISGIYYDTLSTVFGCDSILTIDLQIGNSDTVISILTCESYTVPSGDESYSTSGVYMDTLSGSFGCDSVLTIALTISSITYEDTAAVSCDSFYWHGDYYFDSGLYNDTLVSSAGCDSVVTLDLTLNSVNASVTQDGTMLSADLSGVSYQWIDCSTMALIPGETDQTFIVTENGSYAVIVTADGCLDTSSCIDITDVGFGVDFVPDRIIVYPNPFNDYTTIRFNEPLIEQYNVIIYDALGQEVYKRKKMKSNEFTIKKESLGIGSYLLTIRDASTEKEVFTTKLLIE